MGGGGALPLWSTTEIVASIALAARRHDVREIVFLGDAIHGAGLSEGAARAVRGALEGLRAQAAVTVVAGNHEGRSRGVGVLGETVERAAATAGRWFTATGPSRARRGYRAPAPLAAPRRRPQRAGVSGRRRPGGAARADPYSPGLDVTSEACIGALGPGR